MADLTLTDAKCAPIVARALAEAMLRGERVVTFGPLTLTSDIAGLGTWDCRSAVGHSPLVGAPTPSAIAWLHHVARNSRVAY